MIHCSNVDHRSYIQLLFSGVGLTVFFVPNHIVPLVNIMHDLDHRCIRSDDAKTKQKDTNNVANSKQSNSDTNKQLSILKFNQLFSKHKGDTKCRWKRV